MIKNHVVFDIYINYLMSILLCVKIRFMLLKSSPIISNKGLTHLGSEASYIIINLMIYNQLKNFIQEIYSYKFGVLSLSH